MAVKRQPFSPIQKYLNNASKSTHLVKKKSETAEEKKSRI